MRAAKVQASLRIRAVSPEPPLLAHRSSESRGTLTQKARSVAPLNGWACAVKICHDGMLEDTNSLGGAQFIDSVAIHDRECTVMHLLVTLSAFALLILGFVLDFLNYSKLTKMLSSLLNWTLLIVYCTFPNCALENVSYTELRSQ